MSQDQFRRYRQVGMYGAYRVVMRSIPGLTRSGPGVTVGDGWTPDTVALELAKLVNASLPRDVRLTEECFENGTRWSNWIDEEARYWSHHGWPTASEKPNKGLLPTPDEEIGQRLPENERGLLAPTLFGEASIRRVTAETLASSRDAKSHADLCDTLDN